MLRARSRDPTLLALGRTGSAAREIEIVETSSTFAKAVVACESQTGERGRSLSHDCCYVPIYRNKLVSLSSTT